MQFGPWNQEDAKIKQKKKKKKSETFSSIGMLPFAVTIPVFTHLLQFFF